MIQSENNALILFDGDCVLCSSAVNFILKNDAKNYFVFASLQSDAAKDFLLQYPLKKNNLDSVLLLENEKLYEGSSAAIKIGLQLGWKFKWLYLSYLLPLKLKDYIYYWIAKNRYQWFGKRASCYIPSEKEKSKFL